MQPWTAQPQSAYSLFFLNGSKTTIRFEAEKSAAAYKQPTMIVDYKISRSGRYNHVATNTPYFEVFFFYF